MPSFGRVPHTRRAPIWSLATNRRARHGTCLLDLNCWKTLSESNACSHPAGKRIVPPAAQTATVSSHHDPTLDDELERRQSKGSVKTYIDVFPSNLSVKDGALFPKRNGLSLCVRVLLEVSLERLKSNLFSHAFHFFATRHGRLDAFVLHKRGHKVPQHL